jgi:hypothetical protein
MTKKATKNRREDHGRSLTPLGRTRKPFIKGTAIVREADAADAADASIAPKAARNKEFGRRLRSAMLEKGIKQIQLAELTSIGRDSICGYAKGRIYPGQDRIKIMADALGMRPDQLAVEHGDDAQALNTINGFEVRDLGGGISQLLINKRLPGKVAIEILAMLHQADQEQETPKKSKS